MARSNSTTTRIICSIRSTSSGSLTITSVIAGSTGSRSTRSFLYRFPRTQIEEKGTNKMATQYRADQVGSFLRPQELLEARQNAANDPKRLQETEDRQIKRVLAKQKELGLEIFTDGELRRRNFMSDFTDAVEGFDMGDAVARSWKAGEAKSARESSVTGIVTSKLREV